MATLADMVNNRLPDEAVLFAASLESFIEEARAEAGYETLAEAELSTLQKSLVADMTAKALILPAMSKYKKAVEEAEGDGAGRAKFADKLTFLQEMDRRLEASIERKQAKLSTAADPGVPMQIVE
jgi:hypothetical protein